MKLFVLDTHKDKKYYFGTNEGGVYLQCSIGFKPQDMWIGAYWKLTRGSWRWNLKSTARLVEAIDLSLYVCILPMLPIHIWLQHVVEMPRIMPARGEEAK